MESGVRKALERKKKRVFRIRKKIIGTAARPRMSITKTNRQLFVQLIDDVEQKTLVSMSTLSKEFSESNKDTCNIKTAKQLGDIIAHLATEKGIKQVSLDRRGNKYHGQLAAIADAVRKKGLEL